MAAAAVDMTRSTACRLIAKSARPSPSRSTVSVPAVSFSAICSSPAVTAARYRAAQVAVDRLGEGAGERLVGEIGDQDPVPVERHGAAEQPLGRLLVGEQAVAQRVRA